MSTRTRIAVTACLVVVTLILTWEIGRLIASRQATRVDREMARVESRLQERAADYAQVLRGAVAFLEADARPAPETWRRYIAALDLPSHLAGFEALDVVEPGAIDDTNSVKREAMIRAGSQGAVTLSARLPDARGPGQFVLVAPLRRDGEVAGWVKATLSADVFTRSVLGNGSPLAFEVYDGTRLDPSALLQASGGEAPFQAPGSGDFPIVRQVEVLGRVWTMRYRGASQLVSVTDRLVPWLAFVGGILATWLFHLTTRSAAVVRHQASHDGLTGLANRSLFMKRVQSAAESGRRADRHFALVFIDIDGFKAVNDRHGHHAGDQLLRAIAGRLKNGMRRDDLLSRLGGDEFAAILSGGSDPQADAARYGERVVEQIGKPFTLALPDGDVRVSVGASVGIAVHPRHGVAWDALLNAADEAMYRAKRNGKGRCVLAGELLG